MRTSTSNFYKQILASSGAIAIALLGTLPVSAYPQQQDRGNSTHTSAPARAERAAPERVERSAPVRYEAPARVERAAPVQYQAPVRVERSAPVRIERAPAPVHIERAPAPVRIERAPAPVRIERAPAPVRVERAPAPVRIERAPAPVRIERAPAPVRVERAPAPFVEHVAPQRSVRAVTHAAPFMQIVRPGRVVRPRVVTRTVVTSPLIRAVAAARVRRMPFIYRPRYIAGRIAAIRRNEIIVDPPAGAPVIVRNIYITREVMPVGSVVALPVTYTNGMYQYYQPQAVYAPPYYSSYDPYGYGYGGYNPYGYGYNGYGYSPYGYAPAAYCNGNSSSLLYAALLPTLIGALSGNGSSFNTSDLASIALTAAAGGGSCGYYGQPSYGQPTYGQPYYGQPAYSAPQVSYGYTPPAYYSQPVYYSQPYGTPYDSCMWSDNDGDESCAPVNGYNAYAPGAYGNSFGNGMYAPQQLQGVIIGRTGNMLMVLGQGGTPTYVYAAPALQSGFAMNGPVAPGQIIDAYGYYSGNTFIATAIV